MGMPQTFVLAYRWQVVMPHAHHAWGALQGRDWRRGGILHTRAGQREGVLDDGRASQARTTGACALHVGQVSVKSCRGVVTQAFHTWQVAHDKHKGAQGAGTRWHTDCHHVRLLLPVPASRPLHAVPGMHDLQYCTPGGCGLQVSDVVSRGALQGGPCTAGGTCRHGGA